MVGSYGEAYEWIVDINGNPASGMNAIQLLRAIPNWDNLVNATARLWTGSTYTSSNYYADGNAVYSRHGKNHKLFLVFRAGGASVQLRAGETIMGVQCVDGLFIETGSCTSHLTVTGSLVTLSGSGVLNNGYIVTTTGGTLDTISPTQPINLHSTAQTSSSLTFQWTNGTDNLDSLFNARIETCQVTSGPTCNNFVLRATMGVAGGLASTWSLSGLPALTTQCVRVNNQDQLGNQGPYSDVTCATTTTASLTTRRVLGTDDFNRPNGSVGPAYEHGYTGIGACQIVSNQVQVSSASTLCVETRSDVPPNDHWIEGTGSGVTHQPLLCLGTQSSQSCRAHVGHFP